MANIFLSSEQQGVVVFFIWKSLPYTIRMLLSMALITVGFFIQFAHYHVFPAVLLIFAGNVLLLVRGYDNRVKPIAYSPNADWERVDAEKLQELKEFDKEIKRWDRSILDVSNKAGGIFFFLLLASLAIVLFFAFSEGHMLSMILALDAAVLLLPHWITGIRSILTQPTLLLKIKLIEKLLYDAGDLMAPHQMEYFMLLKGGTLPQDVKFRVRLRNQHPDFLGFYGQIVVNTVSGNKYPYFYVVLVARQGYGLHNVAEQYRPPDRLIKEYSEQGDVEVLVIRQFTTRTSGYHTKRGTILQIFTEGLALAEQVAVQQDTPEP